MARRTAKDMPAISIDADWRRGFARRLLTWYRREARDLPWRRTRDPYAIWVSEVMLQQTQVATVIDYFTRFLAAFPTVEALAMADERDVLRLWEGLGYYRRARQMHRAAKVVVEQHAGRFPHELPAIRALPGIGRYTAGAIASIAFDAKAPILEGNTVRLFSRLVGFDGDTASREGQSLLWGVAETILPARSCGQFNSALMELGSQICTPRAPNCPKCPVRELCKAYALGEQQRIPRPKVRPAIEQVREAMVVVIRDGRWLLRQRSSDERWAGMWDFLRFPMDATGDAETEGAVRATAAAQHGVKIEQVEHVATLVHSVTRFRITLDCYRATASGQCKSSGVWRWVRPGDLEEYPLSKTARKLARLLTETATRPRSTARPKRAARVDNGRPASGGSKGPRRERRASLRS